MSKNSSGKGKGKSDGGAVKSDKNSNPNWPSKNKGMVSGKGRGSNPPKSK